MEELILIAINDLTAMLKETNKKLDALAAGVNGMNTIQVYRSDTEEIITSITNYPDGIKGITAEGYTVRVDGEDLTSPSSDVIIVETAEENPVQICKYENGEFDIADGYRVRIKPKY